MEESSNKLQQRTRGNCTEHIFRKFINLKHCNWNLRERERVRVLIIQEEEATRAATRSFFFFFKVWKSQLFKQLKDIFRKEKNRKDQSRGRDRRCGLGSRGRRRTCTQESQSSSLSQMVLGHASCMFATCPTACDFGFESFQLLPPILGFTDRPIRQSFNCSFMCWSRSGEI